MWLFSTFANSILECIYSIYFTSYLEDAFYTNLWKKIIDVEKTEVIRRL